MMEDDSSNSLNSQEHHRSAMFMRLFIKDEPRIYAYIRSLVINQADAEEVLQETAAIAWTKFDEFQLGTDFVRWSTRIAYWEIRALIKRKRRDSLVFSEPFIEAIAEDTSSQPELNTAVHEALASCLEKLKQRDRDLFHRRYQSGMRIKQIAEQLDRPLDTLHSAFKRIRRILTDCIRNKTRDEEVPWLPRPS